jgi:type IV pilus assembly protein PilA
MLEMLRRRLNKDEQGFTLIELMVVVLIIAILIAIAIPTFLGAQDRARDRGAQSDLRNALTAAKTVATDNAGQFDLVTLTALAEAEGALTYAATGTDDTIGVVGGGAAATAEPDFISFYKQSKSGKWFGIATNKSGEVKYCQATETAGSAGVSGADVTSATDDTLVGCADPKW